MKNNFLSCMAAMCCVLSIWLFAEADHIGAKYDEMQECKRLTREYLTQNNMDTGRYSAEVDIKNGQVFIRVIDTETGEVSRLDSNDLHELYGDSLTEDQEVEELQTETETDNVVEEPQVETEQNGIIEEVSEPTINENGHRLGITILGICCIAPLSLIGIKQLIHELFEHKNKKMDVKLTDVNEELKEVNESDFEIFQIELTKGINNLYDLCGKISDKVLRKDIGDICQILDKIYDNTDEQEFKYGNIARLNGYYVPTFTNLIKSYLDLQDLNNWRVNHTKNELKSTVHKSIDIFNNILIEAIEKDTMEADSEAKVFEQVAEMNGVLETEGTAYLKMK